MMNIDDLSKRAAPEKSGTGVASPPQPTAAHSDEEYLLGDRSLRGGMKGNDPGDQRKRGDLQKRHPEALNQRPPRRPN
jgi:hypothetical protein